MSTILITSIPNDHSEHPFIVHRVSTEQISLLRRLELRVAFWMLTRRARRARAPLSHAEHQRLRIDLQERQRREHEALRLQCTLGVHR